MKKKINWWKPIDLINSVLTEVFGNVIVLYRLRFANMRLRFTINKAKEYCFQDRKKRWIIVGHDHKYHIINKKQIAFLKKANILTESTNNVTLDNTALRIVTWDNQQQKATVNFNKTKQTTNETKKSAF